MKTTQQLHDVGQSLWPDNITRGLLTSGTLHDYIRNHSVTGLTSNPTIFNKAIRDADFYDTAIRQKAAAGHSGETLFYELALEDLRQAAHLFRPIHDATHGADGWVSLEISPLLADDTAGSIDAVAQLHAHAKRPNLFIKIPRTAAGIPAIEESIFTGVPINVTLLFSREQYLAADLDPKVASVASIFVSRWDVAIQDKVRPHLRNRLGIAIGRRTYKYYCEMLASVRWKKLERAGAQAQRLLWASTGTKDPKASDTLYVEALAAPNTINTLPEKTLQAFAQHGRVNEVMRRDGGDAEELLAAFAYVGVNDAQLAAELQREGARAFSKSWQDLLECLVAKSEVPKTEKQA